MKKIIALILALILVCTLVACDSKKTNDAKFKAGFIFLHDENSTYRPARSSYFMNGIVDCALRGGSPEYISVMTNAFCFTEDFFSSLEAKGKVLRSLDDLDPRSLKDQMGALDEFDTREKVCDIRVPTLSIHGLDDIMVEPKLGDYISDRIPGCEVLRIPDVGHIIRPSLYSKEFMEFISKHE